MVSTPAQILAQELIAGFRLQAHPVKIAGQNRFGIRPRTELLGLSMVTLRETAKPHRRNHELALALWAHPIHEAQLLAALTADPTQFTPERMDAWITAFDTWDICDQVCMNVFRRTPHGFTKVREWANLEPEFERRAAFALLATLAVHAKKEPDETFLNLLPLIDHAANDERNFVKKAVNWALRQIGKRRSHPLLTAALDLAEDLSTRESKSARWIGKDALRELSKI
jgi:3-methyladenine DNA glycosylase AlkD